MSISALRRVSGRPWPSGRRIFERLRVRTSSLRWKLAGSYVAVTLLVILTLEAIALIGAGYLFLATRYSPTQVAASSRYLASELRNVYEHTDRSAAAFDRALKPYVRLPMDADGATLSIGVGSSLPSPPPPRGHCQLNALRDIRLPPSGE